MTFSRLDTVRSRPSTVVRTDRSGLTPHILDFLVGPEPPPDRVPEVPVRGPFAVAHLTDQPGRDPGGALVEPGGEALSERAGGAHHPTEFRCQLGPGTVGEPCPHLADERQPSASGGRHSQQEGTELTSATSASLCESADHHLLHVLVLHLDPVATPTTGLIGARPPLCQYPL